MDNIPPTPSRPMHDHVHPAPRISMLVALCLWGSGFDLFRPVHGGSAEPTHNIEIGVRGSVKVAKGLMLLSIYCLDSVECCCRKGQHVM